jgi:hypothetical protein
MKETDVRQEEVLLNEDNKSIAYISTLSSLMTLNFDNITALIT